jgi:hypothetical protein
MLERRESPVRTEQARYERGQDRESLIAHVPFPDTDFTSGRMRRPTIRSESLAAAAAF